MQTMTIFAHELENNDFLEDGRYVYSKSDEGDFIVVELCDDDGETESKPFGPFDPVSVVITFED